MLRSGPRLVQNRSSLPAQARCPTCTEARRCQTEKKVGGRTCRARRTARTAPAHTGLQANRRRQRARSARSSEQVRGRARHAACAAATCRPAAVRSCLPSRAKQPRRAPTWRAVEAAVALVAVVRRAVHGMVRPALVVPPAVRPILRRPCTARMVAAWSRLMGQHGPRRRGPTGMQQQRRGSGSGRQGSRSCTAGGARRARPAAHRRTAACKACGPTLRPALPGPAPPPRRARQHPPA